MRQTLLITVLCTLNFINTAHADGYFAIEGSSLTVGSSGPEDFNPTGFRLRLGKRIAQSFDIEGHMGFTADDDTEPFDELGVDYAGAYLKAYAPIGHRSALFGLAGFTHLSVTQTSNRQTFTDSRNGFSYGFGLETELTDHLDLTADYMRYARDNGLFEDVSAVNIGLKLYF